MPWNRTDWVSEGPALALGLGLGISGRVGHCSPVRSRAPSHAPESAIGVTLTSAYQLAP
jgi:hypothetical protein